MSLVSVEVGHGVLEADAGQRALDAVAPLLGDGHLAQLAVRILGVLDVPAVSAFGKRGHGGRWM